MTIRVSSSPGGPQECYSVKFVQVILSKPCLLGASTGHVPFVPVEGLETRWDTTWAWRGMIVFYHDFDSNVLHFLQAQSPHCQLSQTAWKQCSVYLRESPRALWVFSDEIISLHSLTHAHTTVWHYQIFCVTVLYWKAKTPFPPCTGHLPSLIPSQYHKIQWIVFSHLFIIVVIYKKKLLILLL